MGAAYLLVISNVVPNIWARTNSAMLENSQSAEDRILRKRVIDKGKGWSFEMVERAAGDGGGGGEFPGTEGTEGMRRGAKLNSSRVFAG